MLRRFIAGEIGPAEALAWLIAVTVAITVHEFAHAKRAEMAGDPTPRAMGRVTLNPLAHYDPLGSTLFLVFGFGWAKPVPVNPLAFRHLRRDAVMVALWGPLSNFLTATILAMPIRFGLTGAYTMPVMVIVYANLLLGVFNLIPLGPLDGAHVLEGLLSDRARLRLYAFYGRYQRMMLIVLLLVLFVPQINRVVFGVVFVPVSIMMGLLIGLPMGPP
jgi:Zn-dependent protease